MTECQKAVSKFITHKKKKVYTTGKYITSFRSTFFHLFHVVLFHKTLSAKISSRTSTGALVF